MKKLLILGIVLFAFALQSCEKSELDNQEQSVNLSKIESLKAMDESSQRIAFRLLNNSEKHEFRMNIIDNFIKKVDLNQGQLDLIIDLKLNFTSDVYGHNDKSEYFKNIYVDNWLETAKEIFSMEQIYQITTASYVDESYIEQGRPECKCHMNSLIYCTRKKTTVYELSPDPSVTVSTESVPCESSMCNQPQDQNGNYEMTGCGFAWLHACNGTC